MPVAKKLPEFYKKNLKGFRALLRAYKDRGILPREATERSILITVTQKDIDTAVQCSMNKCVFGNAFHNSPLLNNGFKMVCVGMSKTWFFFENEILIFSTPPQARRFDKDGVFCGGPGIYEFKVIKHRPTTLEQRAAQAAYDALPASQERRKKNKTAKPYFARTIT